MKLLDQKVAVITGGSKGIGRATVQKFVEEGATVVIWDIMEEVGKQIEADLTAAGHKVKYMNVDTRNVQDVEEAAQATIRQFGKIDILINNAGVTKDSTLLKMTHDQWQDVIDINLTGVYHCSKAIAPHMVERGTGVILNASSVVALYGNFGQVNYAATKAGLIGMTKSMAKELGRKGVRVNAVAPGFILTDMVRAMPEDVLAKLSAKVPLGHLGEPEDIANTYLFLSSEMGRYINGATISVDGGISL